MPKASKIDAHLFLSIGPCYNFRTCKAIDFSHDRESCISKTKSEVRSNWIHGVDIGHER